MTEILSVAVEDVEAEVGEAALVLLREGVLEALEARLALVVEEADLAVEHGVLHAEAAERLGDGGEAMAPVEARARDEAHVAGVDHRERAVAIELHLEEPPGSDGDAVGEGRELRLEALEQRLGACFLGRPAPVGPAHAPAAWCPPARHPRRRAAGVALHAERRGRGGRGELFDGAPRKDTAWSPRGDLRLVALFDVFIARLQEEPVRPLLSLAPLEAHERPAPFELLAREGEAEVPFAQPLVGVAVRDPEAPIPHDDLTAAVLALGDRAFKVSIRDGVVLDLDGEALLAR